MTLFGATSFGIISFGIILVGAILFGIILVGILYCIERVAYLRVAGARELQKVTGRNPT